MEAGPCCSQGWAESQAQPEPQGALSTNPLLGKGAGMSHFRIARQGHCHTGSEPQGASTLHPGDAVTHWPSWKEAVGAAVRGQAAQGAQEQVRGIRGSGGTRPLSHCARLENHYSPDSRPPLDLCPQCWGKSSIPGLPSKELTSASVGLKGENLVSSAQFLLF